MPELRNKPTLIARVRLWWYPLVLIPILALIYAGFSAILHPLLGLLGLFCLFFWLFSFGFAVAARFRKPPVEPRQ